MRRKAGFPIIFLLFWNHRYLSRILQTESVPSYITRGPNGLWTNLFWIYLYWQFKTQGTILVLLLWFFLVPSFLYRTQDHSAILYIRLLLSQVFIIPFSFTFSKFPSMLRLFRCSITISSLNKSTYEVDKLNFYFLTILN